MKEYTLFRRVGQACPYNLHIRDNFYSVYQDLLLAISFDEERGKEYFVDNDFYYNKFIFNSNSIYYCIKVREVTKWDSYSKTNENLDFKSIKSKVCNIFDYKI